MTDSYDRTAGGTPLIELRHIKRQFDSAGTSGVRDVSLKIFEGEFVAVVGPSGAGKSTLLNLLGLLDVPDEGSYILDGEDVSGLSERRRDKLRSQFFGFIFQSSFVLGDEPAIHNAAMGMRVQGVPLEDRSNRALESLDQVGLLGRAMTAARLLSGGERQRLAVARAIAGRPRVILADEPTGNLDSENGHAVIDELHHLHRSGVTVIVITHDEAIAAQAERRIVVADGLVSPEGDGLAHGVSVVPTHEDAPVRTSRGAVLLDDFSESFSAMSHRFLRTLLLVLAFALGVGGLVTSVGISESASAQVSDRLATAALNEVRITVPGGSDLLDPSNHSLANWTSRLRKIPHVTGVGFVAQAGASSADIRHLDPFEPEPDIQYQLMTASAEFLRLEGAKTIGPATTTLLNGTSVPNIALVGTGVARGLNLATPGPGASLWVNGRRVSVVGTLRAGNSLPQIAQTVVVSRDVIRSIPGVSVTLLLRTDYGFPASVADAAPLALDPANPGRFDVETVADLRNLRYGVANDLGTFVGILSAILLVLATISAATTMYVSVQSRSSEIALRRAIGASRFAVARLFIIEGLAVGFGGGVIGAAVGTVMVIVGSSWQSWTPVLPANLTPLGIGLGFCTGLASSLVPAWSASRRQPATAIRG